MKNLPLCARVLFFLIMSFFSVSALDAEQPYIFLKDKIEIGRSCYKAGNNEKAYIIFQDLFKKHPENLTINFLLGRTAFELKNMKKLFLHMKDC